VRQVVEVEKKRKKGRHGGGGAPRTAAAAALKKKRRGSLCDALNTDPRYSIAAAVQSKISPRRAPRRRDVMGFIENRSALN